MPAARRQQRYMYKLWLANRSNWWMCWVAYMKGSLERFLYASIRTQIVLNTLLFLYFIQHTYQSLVAFTWCAMIEKMPIHGTKSAL